MEKSPTKILIYIITIIISIFIGCALMYSLIYFFPNTIIKTITKQKVTIRDNGISKAVKKVYDGVVYVQTEENNSGSIGSGFVYKKGEEKAYIITNYHVVNGAESITINYSDDSQAKAEYLGGDEYSDIAVLTVDAKTIKGVAEIGDSSSMEVGDTVFAVGAPLGLTYKGTVTRGILSGKDRMVNVSLSSSSNQDWIMNVMQTDASINSGNSGGPLCNVNGQVIGVTSMKIAKNNTEGLGFAITIEDAMTYAVQIEKNRKVTRPYMGVETVNSSSIKTNLFRELFTDNNQTGVLITKVEENSPADKAKLKAGDIITKINNDKIENITKFRYYLYKNNPNDTIKVQVNRNGNEKTFNVTLSEKS